MKIETKEISRTRRKLQKAIEEQTLVNQRKREIDNRVAELQKRYATLALEEESESSEDSEIFFTKGAYVARINPTDEERRKNKTIPGVVLREKRKGLYLTLFIGKAGPGNYKPENLRYCSTRETEKYEDDLRELSKQIKW